VRILGEVSPSRCEIFAPMPSNRRRRNEGEWAVYKIWQSFAVLLPVRSVGVMATNGLTITHRHPRPWNRRTA